MSKDYKQIDWATDRLAGTTWADDELLMIERIDRRLKKVNKRAKDNKKNHRQYA